MIIIYEDFFSSFSQNIIRSTLAIRAESSTQHFLCAFNSQRMRENSVYFFLSYILFVVANRHHTHIVVKTDVFDHLHSRTCYLLMLKENWNWHYIAIFYDCSDDIMPFSIIILLLLLIYREQAKESKWNSIFVHHGLVFSESMLIIRMVLYFFLSISHFKMYYNVLHGLSTFKIDIFIFWSFKW